MFGYDRCSDRELIVFSEPATCDHISKIGPFAPSLHSTTVSLVCLFTDLPEQENSGLTKATLSLTTCNTSQMICHCLKTDVLVHALQPSSRLLALVPPSEQGFIPAEQRRLPRPINKSQHQQEKYWRMSRKEECDSGVIFAWHLESFCCPADKKHRKEEKEGKEGGGRERQKGWQRKDRERGRW